MLREPIYITAMTLKLFSVKEVFSPYVRSAWFSVHLRNFVLGTQLLWYSEKQTLRTKAELVLVTYGLYSKYFGQVSSSNNIGQSL